MKKSIEKIIKWLYFPPFNKLFSYKVFQYLVCGGGNMVFDLALFAFLYNFVFGKEDLDLGFIVVSPYIAAFLIVFPITLLTGFWLMNNVVFQGSPMTNRTKLSRYMLVVGMNLLINYIGLKVCVEYLHFYPTISKFVITVFCTLVSYISQRHFTFRHYTR
ncbi:GtrA family protein [Parabacteroides sp. PF5-9]|uniref:GtrA family protein n=1 Tax=Parabacteroides sp. PF5-9 TaxID=1742404 RepID=UPI0024759167|nr:GtrA family protein [Parabacteroides sp. PF5-9]MDH6356645.1 putative flippase GtrA [Parabacteroides sp. PF5-9]